MSYEIRKGWPCNGALDEVLVPVEGETLADGSVAVLDATTGRWKNGTVSTTDTPAYAFVIAREDARHTYTGLLSAAVIEIDENHYEDATYTPNQTLGVNDDGFFRAASGTDAVVGKVLQYDATSKRMRLFWDPSATA